MNSSHITEGGAMLSNKLLLTHPVSIWHFVHYFHRPAFRMKSHSHDFFQLYYVTEGSLLVESGGASFRVDAGCLHIQPEGLAHTLSSAAAYTQLGIDFVPDAALRAVFDRPCTLSLPELMPVVHQIAALEGGTPFFREQLFARCGTILYTAAGAVGAGNVSPLRQRIEDVLARDPGGRFSVGELAAALYISPAHLERSCRAFFGMSALALCNRRRFERACVLLMDARISVRAVGEALGFSETSNFSAFFKRYAGVSPAAYRRRYFE